MRLLKITLFFLIAIPSPGQSDHYFNFENINSAFDELNPVLSGDGNTLYVTIANHPDNIGGKKDPGDIWIATFNGTEWSTPVHGGRVINDRAYNAVAGVTRDGTGIYLLNHYAAGGHEAKSQGISKSKKTINGWTAPENIYIPYFHNKSRLICGSMSADGSVLLFSAESYGTIGVEDIYVVRTENGQWSEPKNLGSIINTKFQELSPWLSHDGKTIYFSSNGRRGLGSFDVFSSTRLDDSWTSWSEPINISAVNSEGRELYYQYLPSFGMNLYTSTKTSDGYGDVKFHRHEQIPLVNNQLLSADADTVISVSNPILQPQLPVHSSKVYGRIINSKSGEPVTAKIVLTTEEFMEEAQSSGGDYEMAIQNSGVYAMTIEAPGYISSLQKFEVDNEKDDLIEINVMLQPADVGTTVNLESVLFAQGEAQLLPESYDELDLVISFMKANPKVKIELSGHTDNRGVHEDNVRLSQERANTVKSYLVSKGIDSKRVSGKGYGGVKPIASNETEETRRMNRRVEFVIKKS